MTTKKKTTLKHPGLAIAGKASHHKAATRLATVEPRTSSASEIVITGTSTKYKSALMRLAKK